MKRKFSMVWLAVCMILLLPMGVWAQEGGKLSFGKLKIIPSVALQYNYDDNIFLRNGTDNGINAKVSDNIFGFGPGMAFDYTLDGRGSVRAAYQGFWAWYDDFSDNDWNRQTGLFNLNYRAPAGLIARINNNYTNTGDPFGNTDLFAQGQQTKRWFNDLDSTFGWDFGNRFQTYFYFNYYYQKYDLEQDFSQNWKSPEFGIGGQMRVMPKTWFFLRYHYGFRDYFTHPEGRLVTDNTDASFTYNRVSTGLTWDGGSKLSGELNFGYKWLSYDNATDPIGNLYQNRNTWVARTAVTWDATASTSLTGTVSRAIRLTGGNTAEQFTDTNGGIRLRQRIIQKLTLLAYGEYGYHDFNTGR